VKAPSSRLLRWRLKLEEYHYEVTHKKGSENKNTEALSRIHVTADNFVNDQSESELSDEDEARI
jgi:hypothetical protein